MWKVIVHLGSILILLGSVAISAEKKDPDSAEVHNLARQMLAQAKILPIQSKVLEITGVTRGVQGLLKDLGAKVREHEISIELAADVMFDFNKYDIKPEAAQTLQKVAQVIQGYDKAPIVIGGHTDSVGSDQHNLKLSDQRAMSVKTWLVQNGKISGGRISTKGWGETKPVASNTKPDGSDDPEGRQKNRRVEIVIKTQGAKS